MERLEVFISSVISGMEADRAIVAQAIEAMRLEQLRGQLLQWGAPELRVFVTTRDELRVWIGALEWVFGK